MGKKTGTTTQAVSIPPEVLARYNSVNALAEQVAATPFQKYTGQFVAGLTPQQQTGISNINAAANMAQPAFDASRSMMGDVYGQAANLMQGAFGNLQNTYGQANPYIYGGQQTFNNAYGSALGQMQGLYGAAGNLVNQASPYLTQGLGTAQAAYANANPYFNQASTLMGQGLTQGSNMYQQGQGYLKNAVTQGQEINTQALRPIQNALNVAQPYMSDAASMTREGLISAEPMMGAAEQYLTGGTRAVNPEEFSSAQINKYMSPYLSKVVDAQQALQQQEAAQQRSALSSQAIGAGAFGGDRAGIAQANLARQQSMANQATLANILQQGYGQALGAFQQQQGVNLAAEQANRAAQQFGSQQAAALGQQRFGQQLASGLQLGNLGNMQFQQNIGQGQALAGIGQQMYNQGIGAAAQAANLGQGMFGMNLSASQNAQNIGQGLYNMGANLGAMQQATGQNLYNMNAQQLAAQQGLANAMFGMGTTAGQFQQNTANQLFNMGSQMYNAQNALGQNIFNMGSQTAINQANLAAQQQGLALQGAQAQIGAGTLEQQTQQAEMTAQYQQFLQERGYPFQVAQFLANIAMGTGALSGSTTTTTAPMPFMGSDRRIKEDVKEIGTTHDGLPLYSFKYKGGDKRPSIGVMADEARQKHPDAVRNIDGIDAVDYEKIADRASMGGGVMPQNAREGFALGSSVGGTGASISDDAFQRYLSYIGVLKNPRGGTGSYIEGSKNLPGQAGVVPQSAPPIMQLRAPSSAPRLPESGLSQGISALKTAESGLDTLFGQKGLATPQGAPARAYKALTGDDKTQQKKDQPSGGSGANIASPPPASSPSEPPKAPEDKGWYDKFLDWYQGRAYGGGIRPAFQTRGRVDDQGMPLDSDSPASAADGDDELDKVIKSGAQHIQSLPKPGEPPKPPQSGLGDAAKLLSGANTIGKMGAKGFDFLSGLGGGAEAAGTAAGAAGAGAEAAGAAAGAAEGAGILGSLGSGIAGAGSAALEGLSALAMLLPFSDERVKSDMERVGELDNGQPVYKYRIGDGPTQLGLSAQNVSKYGDPSAVYRDHQGLLHLDYERATREYGGGIRPAYQTRGRVDPEMSDLDYAIRTAAAESSGDPDETRGIAHVIYNRLQSGKYGNTYKDVVLAPKAFEPWQTESNNPMRISPDSPRYQQAASAFSDIESGNIDPRFENVQNFWGPKSQYALGREAPEWGRVGGQDFGGTRFHTLDEVAQSNKTIQARPFEGADIQNSYTGGVKPDQNVRRSVAPAESYIDESGKRVTTVNGKPEQSFFEKMMPINYRTGQPFESVGDYLTDRQFVRPLLTGLAGMAQSKSRYFVPALFEGLGAAAMTDAQAEKMQQEIAESQARESYNLAQTRNMSVQELTPGYYIVYLAKGGTKDLADWMDSQEELVGGQAGAELARKIYARKTGQQSPPLQASQAGQSGTATTGQASEGEVQKPQLPRSAAMNRPEFVTYDNSAADQAKIDFKRSTVEGPQTKERANAQAKKVEAASYHSSQLSPMINEMARNIMDSLSQTGISTTGPGFGKIAGVSSVLGTWPSRFGINIDFTKPADIQAKSQKYAEFLAAAAAQGYGQDTLGAMSRLASVMPSAELPKDVQAELTSQLIFANKKDEHRNDFFRLYGYDSRGVPSSANAEFERLNGQKYLDAQKLTKTLMLDQVGDVQGAQIVKALLEGQIPPKQADDLLRRYAEKKNLPYHPGIATMLSR